MFKLISNPEGLRVAIVNPDEGIRFAMFSALTSRGYREVIQYPHLEDLFHEMKTARPDWVITTLDASSKFNALSFLTKVGRGKFPSQIYVSLYVEKPMENFAVSHAFELGALSAHNSKGMEKSFVADLDEVLDLVRQYRGLYPLVAGEYLRRYQNEIGHYTARLDLERSLVRYAASDPSTLFHLAEVEFIHQRNSDALSHLQQAEMLDPEYSKRALHLKENYISPEDLARSRPSVNPLGYDGVVVVDPDSVVRSSVQKILEHAGITHVEVYESGDKAFAAMKAGTEPQLLITEWRLPGIVSGAALVQRVRQLGYQQTKILVFSALVRKSDEPLLSEMGVDGVLEKPSPAQAILGSLINFRAAVTPPLAIRHLERQIVSLLSSGNLERAEHFMPELLGDSEVENFRKREIEALYAYSLAHYREATELCAESIKGGNPGMSILSIMGRSLLKLRDYRAATTFLEKAQELSPANVQRLIDIAEARMAMGMTDKAEDALSEAQAQDPTNEWVMVAECKIAIEMGEARVAAGIMETIGSGQEVSAQMNNRAVALAQMGRVDESIQIYANTLEALPARWSHLVARVTYNLGLAYARSGHYEKAGYVLAKAGSFEGHDVADKALALARRVDDALKNNKKLSFSTAEGTDVREGVPNSPISGSVRSLIERLENAAKNVSIRPGSYCLFKIFTDPEDPGREAKELASTLDD